MFSMTDVNWRKQNKTVSSRLKTILHKQILSDVVFHVQGKEFRCHRLILALGSPFFEQMFYHTFKITGISPIVENSITPEAFQCVLSFLYTDKVTFGNEAQAFQTYQAADKLQMDDLKSECEIYLSELEIRPRSIWNNLAVAISAKVDKIQRKYMAYIMKNTSDCLKQDSFLSASDEIVMKVLTSEKLAIQEIELLCRLVAWAKYRHLSSSYLRSFLSHIRFRALTEKEFCDFIKDHRQLIEPSDSLAILRYLQLPHKNTLPCWCSRFPRRVWPIEAT